MGRGRVNSELDWQLDSACARPENKDKIDFFFSTKYSEQTQAKKICGTCPVRLQCAKWALENREVFGTWGGLDEAEMRRTLSVNAEGMEIRRDRYPRCPGCRSGSADLQTAVVDRPGGGRWPTMRIVVCTVCRFTWASRTSANAVDAYHAKKGVQPSDDSASS